MTLDYDAVAGEPAAELVALYRERWVIELTFDEIKNHLGPGGRSGRRRRRASGRSCGPTSRLTRPSVSSPTRLRSPVRSLMPTACPT
ncbi:transposase [Streptomyces narbonensis]|uniref:Transposase n=1 Tax=Streptomyces narbonensis TaxID=67333 RepID=A0ABV3CGX2_9ACTN